jgi:hypothetical protein
MCHTRWSATPRRASCERGPKGMSPLLLLAAASAPVPGTVAVVVRDRDSVPAAARYVEAATAALARADFTPLPDAGHSRYVAELAVSATENGVVASRGAEVAPPVYHGGGFSVGLPSRKEQLHALVVTKLRVTVSLRADSQVVWTAEASTARAAGTATGSPEAVATALCDAVLRWFPHPLPGPLSVP